MINCEDTASDYNSANNFDVTMEDVEGPTGASATKTKKTDEQSESTSLAKASENLNSSTNATTNTHYTVGEEDRETTLNTASLTCISDKASQVNSKAQSRARSPRTSGRKINPGRGGGYTREPLNAHQSAWTTIRLSWFEPKIYLKSSVASPDVIDKKNAEDNSVKDQFIISTVHTLFKILTKKDNNFKLMTGHFEEEITPKFFTCQ